MVVVPGDGAVVGRVRPDADLPARALMAVGFRHSEVNVTLLVVVKKGRPFENIKLNI